MANMSTLKQKKIMHGKTTCEAFHLYLKKNHIEHHMHPFNFKEHGDNGNGGADYNHPNEPFLIELKSFKPNIIHKIENKSAGI
tara:strand:- start:235 stop:483 length:249 start_codon:yes stop_codon:yes gene_type:complete